MGRNGLYQVTGEPDSGKTTFALTAGVPIKDILFLDNDMKSQGLVNTINSGSTKFGEYHNLVREFKQSGKQSPLDFYQYVKRILDSTKPSTFQELVFDDWTRMEDGIRAYSMSVMKQISPLTDGQIKGMSSLTWPYTYNVYNEVLDQLQYISPLVILTTHIREKWINNKPTGVFESKGQRPLIEKTNFRVWLRHNSDPNDGGAPIGLVLKRPIRMEIVDGKLKPINILPRRIKPCTWDKIDEYYNNPIGNRAPTHNETPSDYEYSVLDGILTKDQMEAVRFARTVSPQDQEEQDMALRQEDKYDPDVVAMVKEMKNGAGKSVPVIAQEMNLPIPTIAKMLAQE